MQKLCEKSPSAHHHTTLFGYIFATKACIDNRKKHLLNSSFSSTCPHSMANFGRLAAEIVLGVWGTPANFNRFRVLALLVQRHRSRRLLDVWPCSVLVQYVYTFWGLLPRYGVLPGEKFTLCPSLALSYIGSVTAWHSSSGGQPNFAVLSRGRHLYLAGRPSRWALAHILVWLFSR